MVRNGVALGALFVATLVVGALVYYVIGQLVQKNWCIWHRPNFRGRFWCITWRV